MSREIVERQARYLAADNYGVSPDIQRVYWFPDDDEVRLVEVTPQIPVSAEGEVRPFYFAPSPQDNLPSRSAMAMIQPEEFGKLRLPDGWGDWNSAVLIEADE
jgi:hypothetical protein